MDKSPVELDDELVIDITEDDIIDEDLIDLSGSSDNIAAAEEVKKDREATGEKPEDDEIETNPEKMENEYVVRLLCDYARNNKSIKEYKNYYLFDDVVLSKKAEVNFSTLNSSDFDVPLDLELETMLESCVHIWETRHQPDSCFKICAEKKPAHVMEVAPFREDIISCIRGKRNASPSRTEEQEHAQSDRCCDDYHIKEEARDNRNAINEADESFDIIARLEDEEDDLRRRITAKRRKTRLEITEVNLRNIPSGWTWEELKRLLNKHIYFVSLFKSLNDDTGTVKCSSRSDAETLVSKLDDKPPHYIEACIVADDNEMKEKKRKRKGLEEGGRHSPPVFDLRSKLSNRKHREPRSRRELSLSDEDVLDDRYPRKVAPLQPGYREASISPIRYLDDYEENFTGINYSNDRRRRHQEYGRGGSPWESNRYGKRRYHPDAPTRSRSPRRSRPDSTAVDNDQDIVSSLCEDRANHHEKLIEQTISFLEECSFKSCAIKQAGKDNIAPVVLTPSFYKIGFPEHDEETGSFFKKERVSVSPPRRRASSPGVSPRSRQSYRRHEAGRSPVSQPVHRSEPRPVRRSPPHRNEPMFVGKSPRRGIRRSRSVSPRRNRSRSIERSPVRLPEGHSRSRSPIHRVSYVMDYMQELENMKIRHASNWKAFEREPRNHPLYFDEFRCWQKVNYFKNELSPEWLEFWKNKAAQWKADELNEMKVSLQKKYRVDRTPSPTLLAAIATNGGYLDRISEGSSRRSRSRSPRYRSRDEPRRSRQHDRRYDNRYKRRSGDRERRRKKPSVDRHLETTSKYRPRVPEGSSRGSSKQQSLEADRKRSFSPRHGSRDSSYQKPGTSRMYERREAVKAFAKIKQPRLYSRRVCETMERLTEIRIKEEPKEKPSRKKGKNKAKDVSESIMVKDPVIKETRDNLRSTLFFLCDDQTPKQNRLLPVFQKHLGNVANGFPKLMNTAMSMENKKKNFSNSLLKEDEVRSFLNQLKRNLVKLSKSNSLTSYMSGIAKLVSHNLSSLLEISSESKQTKEIDLSRTDVNFLAKATIGLDEAATCKAVAEKLISFGRIDVQEVELKIIMEQVVEAQKNLKDKEEKGRKRPDSPSESFPRYEDSDSSLSSDGSLDSVYRADISKLKEQFQGLSSGQEPQEKNITREGSFDNDRQMVERLLAKSRTMENINQRIKLEPPDQHLSLPHEIARNRSPPAPPPPPQISGNPSFQQVLLRSPVYSSDEEKWDFPDSSDKSRMRKNLSPELYSELDFPRSDSRRDPDSSLSKPWKEYVFPKREPGESQSHMQRTELEPEPSTRTSLSQKDDSEDLSKYDLCALINSPSSRTMQSPSPTDFRSLPQQSSVSVDSNRVFSPRPVSPPRSDISLKPMAFQSPSPKPVPAPLSGPQNVLSSQFLPIQCSQQTNFPPQPVPPPLPVPPPAKPVPQPVPPPNQKYTSKTTSSQFQFSSMFSPVKPISLKEEPLEHDHPGLQKRSVVEKSQENYSNTFENNGFKDGRFYEEDNPVEHPFRSSFSTLEVKKEVLSNLAPVISRREPLDEHPSRIEPSGPASIPFLEAPVPKPQIQEKKPLKGILKKPKSNVPEKEPDIEKEPENDPDFDYLYSSEKPVLPSLEDFTKQQGTSDFTYGFKGISLHEDHNSAQDFYGRQAVASYQSRMPEYDYKEMPAATFRSLEDQYSEMPKTSFPSRKDYYSEMAGDTLRSHEDQYSEMAATTFHSREDNAGMRAAAFRSPDDHRSGTSTLGFYEGRHGEMSEDSYRRSSTAFSGSEDHVRRNTLTSPSSSENLYHRRRPEVFSREDYKQEPSTTSRFLKQSYPRNLESQRSLNETVSTMLGYAKMYPAQPDKNTEDIASKVMKIMGRK